MEGGSTIFIPIGIFLIAASVIVMLLTYGCMLRERREYRRGNKYEDEYGDEYERLKSNMPFCGIALLVGCIVVVFTIVAR